MGECDRVNESLRLIDLRKIHKCQCQSKSDGVAHSRVRQACIMGEQKRRERGREKGAEAVAETDKETETETDDGTKEN